MGLELKDGTGTGVKAQVDENHDLHCVVTSQPFRNRATDKGDSYNLNSGLITLTDAAESAVMYLKNNEVRDLKITAIVVILGPSTNGATTDTCRIRFYKNTTGGTVVSDATALSAKSNRNFGSSNTLTADAFKGDQGKTQTGGSVHIESLVAPNNRVFFTIDEVLTKGDSISVTYEPPDSNTSMKCMAAIIVHIRDKNHEER